MIKPGRLLRYVCTRAALVSRRVSIQVVGLVLRSSRSMAIDIDLDVRGVFESQYSRRSRVVAQTVNLSGRDRPWEWIRSRDMHETGAQPSPPRQRNDDLGW